MKTTAVALALVLSGAAHADPLAIDLTPELVAYQAKARPRTVGLILLATTLALGATSAFGYSQAAAARGTLSGQTIPVNLMERRDLVAQGEQANVLGLVTALIGLCTGVGSGSFLAVSF